MEVIYCNHTSGKNVCNKLVMKHKDTHKCEKHLKNTTKLCIFNNCDEIAIYGTFYKQRKYCIKHKEKNMYITEKPKCITINCNDYAFYGMINPIYCEFHNKYDNDIIHKYCSICQNSFIPYGTILTCDKCNTIWKYGQYDNCAKYLLVKTENINKQIVKKVCNSKKCMPHFIINVGYDLFTVIMNIRKKPNSGYGKMCETSLYKEITRLLLLHKNYIIYEPIVIIFRINGVKDILNNEKILANILRKNRINSNVIINYL